MSSNLRDVKDDGEMHRWWVQAVWGCQRARGLINGTRFGMVRLFFSLHSCTRSLTASCFITSTTALQALATVMSTDQVVSICSEVPSCLPHGLLPDSSSSLGHAISLSITPTSNTTRYVYFVQLNHHTIPRLSHLSISHFLHVRIPHTKSEILKLHSQTHLP